MLLAALGLLQGSLVAGFAFHPASLKPAGPPASLRHLFHFLGLHNSSQVFKASVQKRAVNSLCLESFSGF